MAVQFDRPHLRDVTINGISAAFASVSMGSVTSSVGNVPQGLERPRCSVSASAVVPYTLGLALGSRHAQPPQEVSHAITAG